MEFSLTVCKICDKQINKSIGNHLKAHKISMIEYMKKYLGYKDDICRCGCNTIIPVQRHWLYYGVPEVYKGHWAKLEERKKHIRELYIGRKASEETRHKMSKSATGKVVKKSTRKKLSEALRKYYKERGFVPRKERKKVICACGCGKEFYVLPHMEKKFLNNKHKVNGQRGKIPHNKGVSKYPILTRDKCLVCGKEFEYIRYSINHRKTCSKDCKEKASWIIKPLSERKLSHKVTHPHLKYILSKRFGKLGFRSSYEEKFIKLIEAIPEVISVDYEPIKIPYSFGGRNRLYIPDFKIHINHNINRDSLIEIKSKFWIENKDSRTLAKIKAGKDFSIKNNIDYLVFTEAELSSLEKDGFNFLKTYFN